MLLNRIISLVFVCAVSLIVAVPRAGADDGQFATNAPKQLNDFAFWLGDWKFVNSTPSKSGLFKDARGYNHISVTFDGYAILEDFGLGEGEQVYRGGSLTVAIPNTDKIRQTWIDNSGWTKVFEGGWESDRMILVGPEETASNGDKFTTRLVWKNITNESMDWSYERSVDGGKSWTSIWDIHYVRIN